jgi:wyosine [tRNA(Phe)-imidazoG37] synthetase (radical SAM superfamily)
VYRPHRTVIFGPVISRRLGRSLGIDLVAPGTCSFDCVYCECGRTTQLMTERREYGETDRIIADLDRILASHPALDFLTFAGSGEPTLSLSLGKVIRHLKEHTSYPVAVLTNGSLLWQRDVQNELRPIDLLIPTLTTAREETFRRIHRPHPSLCLSTILEGMVTFRTECPVEMWLEVFLIPGINTTFQELEGMRDWIARIRPHRVQLNTRHRPPAESWVQPASTRALLQAKAVFEETGVPVEIVCAIPPAPHIGPREKIHAVLSGRACTVEEIMESTNLSEEDIRRYLAILEEEGQVKRVYEMGQTLYWWHTTDEYLI